MFRNAGFILAGLALFFIAGGHWAALQSLAWAEMLVQDTQANGSLRAAVERTFDGEHPCDLCRTVAAGRAEDQRQQSPAQPSVKTEKKAEKALAMEPAPRRVEQPARVIAWPMFSSINRSAPRARPPTPPPRVG